MVQRDHLGEPPADIQDGKQLLFLSPFRRFTAGCDGPHCGGIGEPEGRASQEGVKLATIKKGNMTSQGNGEWRSRGRDTFSNEKARRLGRRDSKTTPKPKRSLSTRTTYSTLYLSEDHVFEWSHG